MATSRSFIYTSVAPPPRYRTPSPPRGDVEPISPYTVDADWPHNSTTDPTDLRLSFGDWDTANDGMNIYHEGKNAWEHAGERKSRAGTAKHSRTGSTIDTLATIALATSPTFASPTLHTGFGDILSNRKTMPSDTGNIERPSKRARSEKARSPVLQRTEDRPATSHIPLSEVLREDVELLLNFASFNSNSRTATSTHYVPESSPIEVKWKVPTNGLDDPFISENTQPTTIRLLSPPTESPDLDGMNNDKHPTTPQATSFAKPSQSQSQTSDAKDSAEPSLHLQPPLTEESLATRQVSVDEDVKTDLNHINGDIDEPPFPDSSTEPEPESHDMATATCAACDSAWIDENGADPDGATCWIRCDGCKRWFHLSCTEIKDEEEVKNIDKFNCKDCEPTHGPTTYVRKSSRTRTAIDYAGLNQGVVKASVDGPAHHYIQPIKDGKLKFLPESFPRMRAELVTAEYFEKSSGMTEPIVIPASMNPRSSAPVRDDAEPELYYPEEDDSSIDFSWPDDLEEEEEVVDCGQDGLDMVIPQGLTVRMVADLYGPDEKVEVIDVKSQQGEDKRWNMRKWADYYESEGNAKVIRNVISLEVSQTRLGKLIRRPKIVRHLDLQDSVWPQELKAMGDYPKVQFYCLMSVADCYTDFHIDFGGSSVFYHILKGKKTFFFIPPKEKYLKKYEDWCNSSTQDTVFLGEETKECYRVDLSEGDTMLIPAGWIHAVWTPENSLVIGGNFLTRLHYGMQIKIAKIEKDTKVARKFRYPYFQKILWYAAIKYIEDDPLPSNVLEAFHNDENYRFYRKHPIHYEFGKGKSAEEAGSELYNARYYPQAELDGLPDLAKYLLRTAIIAQELLTEGITIETRRAVKRSIPKGHGEALDIIKVFGIWLAWKRGNERAANWTHPDMFPSSVKADAKWTRQPEKNTNASKKAPAVLEGASATATNTNRQSPRKHSVQTPMAGTGMGAGAGEDGDPPMPDVSSPSASRASFPSTPKSSGLGPKRVACDACRKRRIRCRHKDESSETKKKSYATRVEMNTKPPSSSSSKPAEAVGDDAMASPTVSRDFTQIDSSLSVNGPALFSKKGRSKACDECRKSKVGAPCFRLEQLFARQVGTDSSSAVASMTNLAESTRSKLKSLRSREQQERPNALEPATKACPSLQPRKRSKSPTKIIVVSLWPSKTVVLSRTCRC
jgi:F-box and leucine-rich repeat protein 10/11